MAAGRKKEEEEEEKQRDQRDTVNRYGKQFFSLAHSRLLPLLDSI